ncbi:MAG: hypothetical protein KAR40_16030 [Candidatus Sabulitectum sp.]|nr:hypothetical protein [Candidatus Sabulitectum sp.]
MGANDMAIKIKRYNKANNVKDVIALVRFMVDKFGYVTARLKLLAQYNIEITIDFRTMKGVINGQAES